MSLIFFVPRIRPMKTLSTGQAFSKGLLGTFFPLLFPPILQLLSPSYHCLQSIGQIIIFSFLKVVVETVYLRLGLKPTWQRFCAMLNHSVRSDQDLNPAKIHDSWFQDLMKHRFLMFHCKKRIQGKTAIGKRWICLDLKRSTVHRV